MKLLSAIIASAYAINDANVVHCDVSGTISMKLRISNPVDNKVPDGFAQVGASADWETTITDVSQLQKDWATTGKLKLIKEYDAPGCNEEVVDGVTVCVATGNFFKFTCTYDLDDKTIDDDFNVTGQDTAEEAEGTGTLGYDLTVNNNNAIGDTVTFTITPKNADLVAATVKSCTVSNLSNASAKSVTIIGQGTNDRCLASEVSVAADASSPQLSSKGAISGTWQAFKWATSTANADAEQQSLACTIGLSQNVVSTSNPTC